MTGTSVSPPIARLQNNRVSVAARLDSGEVEIAWPHAASVSLSSLRPGLKVHEAQGIITCTNWQTTVADVEDRLGRGTELILHSAQAGHAPISLTLRLRVHPDRSGLAVRAEVENHGPAPLALDELTLLRGRARLGVNDDTLVAYLDSGDCTWSGVARLSQAPPKVILGPEQDVEALREQRATTASHLSRGVSVIHDTCSSATLLAGFITFERALTEIGVDYLAGTGVRDWWAAVLLGGYTLASGERFASEWLWLDASSDPLAALEAYGDLVRTWNGVQIFSPPPIGWLSWYGYRVQITEEEVLRNARFMAEHFQPYGLQYIQIDHGWQWQNSWGTWDQANERFPHGLRWLADQIHALGLKFGLWLAPFNVLDDNPLLAEHPEWLLRDASGEALGGQAAVWQGPWHKYYFLDVTRPDVQDFLCHVIRHLRGEGCEYWKLDFMMMIKPTKPHNPQVVPTTELFRTGLCILKEEMGKGDVLNCATSPTNPSLGLGSTVHICLDIGNPGISDPLTRRYFKTSYTTVAARWFLNGRFWVNEPDAVNVGEPGHLEEARLRATLGALAGATLTFSEDMAALAPERLEILQKLLPHYGVAARPVDLFSRPYPEDYPRILVRDADFGWDRWLTVGVFNLDPQPREVVLPWRLLGLDEKDRRLLFEFWTQTWLGEHEGKITVNLPPESARLFVLRQPRAHPWVVATDMHVTMGGCDLSEVAWDDSTAVLHGLAHRKPSARGRILVHAPETWEPVGTFTRLGRGLVALDLGFIGNTIPWQLAFTRKEILTEKTQW
jgi:alpha-galactosidase